MPTPLTREYVDSKGFEDWKAEDVEAMIRESDEIAYSKGDGGFVKCKRGVFCSRLSGGEWFW